MLAAPRIVLIDLAVRPCRPITLPRSVGATRNSKIVASPSSTGVTWTCSGASTRACAICSTSIRMSPLPASVINGVLHSAGARIPCLACSGKTCCRLRGGRGCALCLGEQTADCVRKLCALGNPVINTVALQVDRRGVGAGIVQSHHFHGAAVARPLLVDHHHAIVRLLARTNARQSYH